MKNVAERLDFARHELKLSYDDLGEIIGTTGNAIRTAIKRGKVRELYINIAVEKLNINKNWLQNGVGEPMLSNVNSLDKVKKYLENDTPVAFVEEPKESYYKDLVDLQKKYIKTLEEKIEMLQKK